MSACLALEPVKTLDAGLPALSGRLGQVRTRKEAFDLLACFLREQGLSDLILTFIPPGDVFSSAASAASGDMPIVEATAVATAEARRSVLRVG